MIDIKELTIADVTDLQKIRLQSLKNCPQAFGSSFEEESKWDKSVYENRIKSNESFYFGAFNDNSIIGIVALVLNVRKKTKHRASIASFYVNSAFSGQGIGKKLISFAIEKAYSLKIIEQIELSVVTEQLAAISIYINTGFEIYGEEFHSLKINQRYYNEFLMMKKLFQN